MTENAEAEGREPRPIRKTGIPIRWCFGAVLLVLLVFFGFSRVDTPEDYESKRDDMVRHQIVARGIKDEAVIAAMSKVPRHLFVPEAYRSKAYSDGPLPIGEGQTISQPYIVALMTELLELDGDEKVLEIGTGSGYQAAVLAEITKDVYSIEIMPALYKKAGETLQNLGYDNVHLKLGNGYFGWEEHAPFDVILVTAAPTHIPQPLITQLVEGGIIVIPVETSAFFQTLQKVKKVGSELDIDSITPVRFVPLILSDGEEGAEKAPTGEE